MHNKKSKKKAFIAINKQLGTLHHYFISLSFLTYLLPSSCISPLQDNSLITSH